MDEKMYLELGETISQLTGRTLARVHPQLGVKVSPCGEVLVPENGARKAHWTFGCTNSRGYRQVRIKNTSYCVHRLVVETFIQYPIPDGYEIDHLDRVRDNNRLENLRIVTHRDNCHNTPGHDRVDARGGTHVYEDARQAYHEKYARYKAEHPEKLREYRARSYQATRKTHKRVRFADGSRHYIPHEEAEALLKIPLKQRIYKENGHA